MKKRVELAKKEIKHEREGGWIQERTKQTCMVRKNKVNTLKRKVMTKKNEDEYEH